MEPPTLIFSIFKGQFSTSSWSNWCFSIYCRCYPLFNCDNESEQGDYRRLKSKDPVNSGRISGVDWGVLQAYSTPRVSWCSFVMLGIPIACTSLYGFAIIVMALLFLHFQIETEEKMRIDALREDYKKYQKRTKKLIPRLYWDAWPIWPSERVSGKISHKYSKNVN